MFNKFKKLDMAILFILILLMIGSFFIIRSAIHGEARYDNYDYKTLIFYGAGFFVAILTVLFDYRLLLKTWYISYGIGIVLLVAVYFFAPPINNARSWFELPGGLLFQPAELMKILLIIALAYWIGRREGSPLLFTSDLLPIALVALLPFMLVMIQPDLGNAIIYLVILLGMLWIGNVKYSHVLIGLVTIIAMLMLFVSLFETYNAEIKTYLQEKDKTHWYQRINTFIHPDTATNDEKHQSRNAMIAIGSGGLAGDGYLQGDSKNGRFIPYPYSDSIFVVIGEEFGFQGAALLLLLYFLLIYRMIIISFQCYDMRGSFIIIGIASMFVFQIFQNIGMMIGIMPITGITLPFVSYGGTSLLINMICIGIVFSIRAHQVKPEGA
ncbi:rod shape-determining protein RodA [Paenibacillaceae bacterium]|nr:rod shape-determining protein RodA [Paenibacillaceae bacterium]